MALPHEHDGSQDAIEQFLKEGIMLVTQYVKHHKAQQIAQQTEAARRDHELKIAGRQECFQQDLAAKLGLDRASAALRYAQVGNEQWWRSADAATILDTYKDAALHADQDPQAAQTLEVMGDYMKVHMGIDVEQLTGADEEAGPGDLQAASGAYADHLENGEGLTSDGRPDGPAAEFESFEQQFTGTANVEQLMAGVRDFQLSRALSTAASPHTIAQVADAADTDLESAQARSTSAGAELAGERDNLDR